MATQLNKVLEHLHRVLSPPGGDLTDGQLLARFVAARDEASFAALVRRHGPMVLGVCRRLLRHTQDAEDCFQASFLVLARQASAVRSESVGSWLYAVAYRTSLEARTVNARRRSRERQVEDIPHPEAKSAESLDWRPWLDQELSRLPEKYRAAIVACDLEGRSRAGPLTAVSPAIGLLTKGVLKAMFLAKLKLVVGAVMIVTALGASSLVYRAAGQSAPAEKRSDGKSLSELERLRRENDLLKLNPEVVLEKVRAQEAELHALKENVSQRRILDISQEGRLIVEGQDGRWLDLWIAPPGKDVRPAAVRALQAVGDALKKEAMQRAIDALEKALKELREQLKKPEGGKP